MLLLLGIILSIYLKQPWLIVIFGLLQFVLHLPRFIKNAKLARSQYQAQKLAKS